ncbi:MAG: OB-fold domain-containing protein [Chloroflexi bacterium]|nr:OB-fold domain-containing protein [Chloroflexota bacterium]
MTGIISYGAYVPYHRINRKTIFGAMGWLDAATNVKGEKAICNYDEDTVTMAVTAGIHCLKNVDRGKVDGVYLATISSPAVERQAAGTVASALDMEGNIRSADFSGSTKVGTAAIVAACDAVKAGSLSNVLACASDSRTGKPGSGDEQNYGDASTAFLIGNDGVIAEIAGSHSVSYDFMGHWEGDTDDYGHFWEARWITDEGYNPHLIEAAKGVLKQCSVEIDGISKVIIPSINARAAKIVAKKLKLADEQVQTPVFDMVGDCGNAQSPLMLAAALDEAKPGDKILVLSYGNGADAILIEATEAITGFTPAKTVSKMLETKREITNYNQYLVFREVLPVETGIRGEELDAAPTQVARLWRERKEIMALCGSKCKKCGTPQYPFQKVCVNPDCGAIDEGEWYRFSDKKGKLFTYTVDSLAFTFNPPQVYGVIEWEGGGKFWFDISDCDPDNLEVGMEMEMSFRRKYHDKWRGLSAYFWKAIPVLD